MEFSHFSTCPQTSPVNQSGARRSPPNVKHRLSARLKMPLFDLQAHYPLPASSGLSIWAFSHPITCPNAGTPSHDSTFPLNDETGPNSA